MKTATFSLLAILIGCMVGVGSTAARYGLLRGTSYAASTPDSTTLPAPADGARPVLEIDVTEFDFGTMERDAKAHHIFLVRNTGGAPLTLENGGSTCKCTILGGLEDEAAIVEPGESHEVELEWTAKTSSDEFRQTATINTNDPLQPRVVLSIQGQVADSIRVTPSEIVLSKVDSDQLATARLRITSLRDEPIEILGHELRDQEGAQLIDVEIRQVAPDEIADATVKHAVEVTIQLHPGLPIGPIDELLKIETNITGRELIEVPILGRVVSRVSISGRGWNEELGQLALGTVSGSQGVRHELSVNIRGANAEQVELSVGEISTDAVQVSFGERKILGEGRLVRVPLIVEIPAGSRAVNFLGGTGTPPAEIMIHTTHPQAPKLRILVRFATEL